MRLSALALLLACCLAAPAATAQIVVSPEAPVVGEEVTVSVPGVEVDTLLITYRPGSAIAEEEVVRVGGFESVRVRFEDAGVVRVAVPGGPSRNVSVRFDETPTSGLLILIVAGLILFGGATFAMTKLLSRPAGVVDRRADEIEHMPDT